MTTNLLGAVPDWHDDALCRQVDGDLFYPEKGRGISALRQAKQVCGRCPVKTECGADALARSEPYGVWGGVSETERKRLLRLARIKEARLAREAEEASC